MHKGKHSFFKDLASNIKNFKNLPYYLAMKHQKVECANSIVFVEYTDTSTLFGHEEYKSSEVTVVFAMCPRKWALVSSKMGSTGRIKPGKDSPLSMFLSFHHSHFSKDNI